MAYSSGRMDKINYQTPVMELAKFIEMIGGGAVGGLASCGAGRRWLQITANQNVRHL